MHRAVAELGVGMSDWRTEKVIDLQRAGILLVEDGNHGEYRPRPGEFVDQGVVFIRAADINDGQVLFESASKISEIARKRITKGIGAPGDVLLSHKGTVGKLAMVPEDAPPFVCSPQTTFWRALNSDVLDRRYLYSFMRSPLFRAQLGTRASETDMAPYVSLTSQRALSVAIPPIGYQRTIAHILGTLDDKIELNRRMNETLEAMARTIFKSWFVDFDPVRAKLSGEPPESICRRLGLTPALLDLFSGRLKDSELGEIPEEWGISTVEDLSLKVGMGPFGSNIKVSTFVEKGIPVISGQHLNGTMLEDNTFNFITPEHADRLASSNVGRGDVIFTHAGNIGQVSYIPDHSYYERYVLSQRQFYLRCDVSKASPIFMTYFFKSPLGQHNLLANASQVGVPSIARPVSYLKSIELVAPPREVAEAFDTMIRRIHHRDTSLRIENKALIEVRDTLLPRLLSGKIHVSTEGDT